MTEENFVDYVKIQASSGNGGKGSMHFRREKYVARGGPDGGDGGRGGHVIIKGNSNLWTLYHFKFKKHFNAENGENGGKSRKYGKFGKNIYIDVPIGTIIKQEETNNVLFEITTHGEEKILLEGGKGGLGNWHFKSATRQAPQYAQPGEKGKEIKIILELKVLADVGLVGFPNAGKSTLLSVLTSAKPKIANYEFTTLKPNLGIVHYKNYQTFIIADIPGIIEKASEGKGLGHYFLRHIERNNILLFLISVESEDIKKTFSVLHNELKKYNPDLLHKKYIIVFSKIDLLDKNLKKEYEKKAKKTFTNHPYLFVSSVTEEGVEILKNKLWELLQE